jgi:hypothetical protein
MEKDLFTISKDALQEKILTLLPTFIENTLTDSYDSPIKKAVEEAVKLNEGAIKTLTQEMITKMISDEKFKQKLAEQIISRVLLNGLK